MSIQEVLNIALGLVGLILGGGGLAAYSKARSEIRNNNKSADIASLEKTIEIIQKSNCELKKNYQEIIDENEERCAKLADRLETLEENHIQQTKKNVEQTKKNIEQELRITELEAMLESAQGRIEILECQLKERDAKIIRLEKENIKLRKSRNSGLVMN